MKNFCSLKDPVKRMKNKKIQTWRNNVNHISDKGQVSYISAYIYTHTHNSKDTNNPTMKWAKD